MRLLKNHRSTLCTWVIVGDLWFRPNITFAKSKSPGWRYISVNVAPKKLENQLPFELERRSTTHFEGFVELCSLPLYLKRFGDYNVVWLTLIGKLVTNQLVPISSFYHCLIFSNITAMNTAQQNLQNEWSINVLAQKEVGFSIFLVLRFVIYNVSQCSGDRSRD